MSTKSQCEPLCTPQKAGFHIFEFLHFYGGLFTLGIVSIGEQWAGFVSQNTSLLAEKNRLHCLPKLLSVKYSIYEKLLRKIQTAVRRNIFSKIQYL